MNVSVEASIDLEVRNLLQSVVIATASFSVTAATKEESMVEAAMGLPAELGKSSL